MTREVENLTKITSKGRSMSRWERLSSFNVAQLVVRLRIFLIACA